VIYRGTFLDLLTHLHTILIAYTPYVYTPYVFHTHHVYTHHMYTHHMHAYHTERERDRDKNTHTHTHTHTRTRAHTHTHTHKDTHTHRRWEILRISERYYLSINITGFWNKIKTHVYTPYVLHTTCMHTICTLFIHRQTGQRERERERERERSWGIPGISERHFSFVIITGFFFIVIMIIIIIYLNNNK